jgi:methylenetetrahydrofolate reductase (NADPH)
MKVTQHLAQAKKTLFTFEILPPLKGESAQAMIKAIEPLVEFKPAFIDVTYHRAEYIFKPMDNGLLKKQVIRKRPGTIGMCAAISNRFGVDTVPHLICGGFTKEETEDVLIELNFLGVENVLALRGDPVRSETAFTPEDGGHRYASELVQQVVNMNKSLYLEDDLIGATKTDFCIGVAGYPEKHYEAPNLDFDLKYLKHKVDLGAEYIVTQMFFDNQKYFDFVKRCREAGIHVPIIPGLKPLIAKSQLTVLPRIFHIDIPQALVEAIEACRTKEDVQRVGVEWCIQQSKELMAFGVPCLHFYSMSKSDAVKKVASEIF